MRLHLRWGFLEISRFNFDDLSYWLYRDWFLLYRLILFFQAIKLGIKLSVFLLFLGLVGLLLGLFFGIVCHAGKGSRERTLFQCCSKAFLETRFVGRWIYFNLPKVAVMLDTLDHQFLTVIEKHCIRYLHIHKLS